MPTEVIFKNPPQDRRPFAPPTPTPNSLPLDPLAVPLVDVDALARGHVPLPDGVVVAAGQDVVVVDGHAVDEAAVAPVQVKSYIDR